MPNGHSDKEYGGHKYAGPNGTSDCEYGCGCWMGSARSGGPTGLDPFGKCPKNPKDGKLLGGNADYDCVVNQRIQKLTNRMQKAENRLKRTSPTKQKLAEEIVSLKKALSKKDEFMAKLAELIERDASSFYNKGSPTRTNHRPVKDNINNWLF